VVASQEEFYPEPQTETLLILFRIVSRKSWDDLQGWHEAFPGSRVEHVLHGIYVLVVEPGGTRRLAK
jgi:hypothetical protein